MIQRFSRSFLSIDQPFFGKIPCWFLECHPKSADLLVLQLKAEGQNCFHLQHGWLNIPALWIYLLLFLGLKMQKTARIYTCWNKLSNGWNWEISRVPVSLVTRCWRPIETLASTAEKWCLSFFSTPGWWGNLALSIQWKWRIQHWKTRSFPCPPVMAVLQAMSLRIAGTLTCHFWASFGVETGKHCL